MWKPIKTAPKNSTPIDIWSLEEGRLTNYKRIEYSPNNIFYDSVDCGFGCIRDATHWMPIPETPNKKI
jgi:hypothetical protein